MRRTTLLLSALLLSLALVAPAVVGVPAAGAASGSNGNCQWTVNTPGSAYGVIYSDANPSCVMPSGFGQVYGILKLWDYYSGAYHMVVQSVVTVNCTIVFGLCYYSPKIHVQTGLYPPNGNYHAEVEVIGGLESQAPDLSILDDANSAGYCHNC
jgi:hypothetical protein